MAWKRGSALSVNDVALKRASLICERHDSRTNGARFKAGRGAAGLVRARLGEAWHGMARLGNPQLAGRAVRARPDWARQGFPFGGRRTS